MTRRVGIVVALGALVLAGCATSVDNAAPSASPAFSAPAECERNGGWWRPTMNFCEYQSPSEPPLRR